MQKQSLVGGNSFLEHPPERRQMTKHGLAGNSKSNVVIGEWQPSHALKTLRCRSRAIIGVLAVMALVFCGSSAGALQSHRSRSYIAGRRFAATYVVMFRTADNKVCAKTGLHCPATEKSGLIIYPVATAKGWCTLLMKGDVAFRGDRNQWLAGCVSTVKDADFLHAPSGSAEKVSSQSSCGGDIMTYWSGHKKVTEVVGGTSC